MKLQKSILFALVFLSALILSAQPARAAEYAVAGGQTLNLATGQLTWTEGGGLIDTYTISDGDTINIAPGAAATVKGTKNVMIVCGAGAALTLDGVTANTGGTSGACALSFAGDGNTLNLIGTSYLTSGENAPGIRAEAGCALEIKGEGSLTAQGGQYAAGIGGGFENSGGSITVSGGTVAATGGAGIDNGGAGIGGGSHGNGGAITISGGAVTAAGGAGVGGGAAGVGGGESGSGGTIMISGGTINAAGTYNGAGIGGGGHGDGGAIVITGGTVAASSVGTGAGIGGGYQGTGGEITISGGNVTASCEIYAAGIGGGSGAEGGIITIKDAANVTATGGELAAGIGGGDESNGGEITISGGTVHATGGFHGTGIGSGDAEFETGISGGNITISGGNVTAQGGFDAAAIGGGYEASGGTITISGGTVLVTGGENGGAGIGSGDAEEKTGISGGNITISGGDVTAIGSEFAAAIGCGDSDAGGQEGTTINISGGTVTASSISDGAGIGGGYGSDGGNITISGGTIQATGGDYCAGIGGGEYGSGGSIKIENEADVTATGGDYGAGIGGGFEGSGGSITISGGTVAATGGESGAGIGSGDASDETGVSGGTITISGGDVTAIGSYGGAGIGGGDKADGGSVDINGGVVYATKGAGGYCDIGKGNGGDDGVIGISDGAEVLLGTDSISPTPTAPAHTHYTFTEKTPDVYGIPVPEEWEPPFGAYLILYDLNYNANGGRGTLPPPVTDRATGAQTTVGEGGGLEYGKNIFAGWNTADDGSGKPYAPGDTFTFKENTTLYAQWTYMYTLSYNANGGIGDAPEDITQEKGSETTVAENPFTKTKGKFTGWNTAEDGSGEPYGPWDEFIFEADTTLYAQWADLYTLSYNANGGSGEPPEEKTQIKGSETMIASNPFTKVKGEFNNWNTAADGSGTPYAPGDVFTFEADTTLYAQWEDLYTLSYNANGGSGSVPLPVTKRADSTDKAVTVKNSGSLERPSHIFTGWNTAADGGGEDYEPGNDLILDRNVTLYAQWTVLYTLSYDANGGGGSAPSAMTQEKGTQTFAAANTYTWDGHVFAGWNTAANGSGRSYAPGEDFTLNRDITLHAQWDVPVVAVTLNSTFEKLEERESAVLTATVKPGGASYPGVEWKSTNPSVATVSRQGVVRAVSKGAATIIAEAGGRYAVCTVSVNSEEDAEEEADSDNKDRGAMGMADIMVTITILGSDLPKGTAAVRLPNGETVTVDGQEAVQIKIGAEYLNENGLIEVIPLDGEGVPMGGYFIEEKTALADGPDGEGGWSDALVWILIIIAGAGAAGYLIWRKLRRKA